MAPNPPDGRDPDEHHDGDVGLATEQDERVRRPPMFRVLLHNDDYSTMGFVVMILMDVFNHPQARAVRIMLAVHEQGVGVAGIYGREIAETKVAQVTELAHENEFPLLCTLEPA